MVMRMKPNISWTKFKGLPETLNWQIYALSYSLSDANNTNNKINIPLLLIIFLVIPWGNHTISVYAFFLLATLLFNPASVLLNFFMNWA